ncbi:hypothetical protein [Infirmifilum sp.]
MSLAAIMFRLNIVGHFGLNEDRKGFKKILKLTTERKISKIVVA